MIIVVLSNPGYSMILWIYDIILDVRLKSWPWNKQEFWQCLQWKRDLASYSLKILRLKYSQPPQGSPGWLPEYLSPKDNDIFKAQIFVACSSTQSEERSLSATRTLKQHTKVHKLSNCGIALLQSFLSMLWLCFNILIAEVGEQIRFYFS